MSRSIHQTTGRISPQALAGWVLILALAFLPGVSLHAAAPPPSLRISNTGQDLESLQTFQLGWDALSNATYLVQSADSLAPGSPWQTLDAVQSPDKAGSYQFSVVATDSTGQSPAPAKFYRLILPQPQIFSVEPAVVAPGVPVDFYVIGQCFPTNVVLQINGVTQAGAVVVSSSLATIPGFTPGVGGNYQVSLVAGGVVVSSFNVVCADPLANPELVLQGPPQEPPASPGAMKVVNKGQVNGNISISQAGRMMVGNPNGPGLAASADKRGYVAGKYAIDIDGRMAVSGTKSAQVPRGNISNNRMSGGGGVSDPDSDPTFMAALMKAKEKANQCKSMAGVQPFSGEVQACDVDLAIPGRSLDFVWARNYHSRIGRLGAATNGWTFSYDVRCAQNSSGGLDVYDGTGRKDTFTLQTNGTYTCPEFFREGTQTNGVFRLTFADTGYWEFNPFGGSATGGKLAQIVDRNGNTMSLGYDTSGRLAQVADDLGRTNSVVYNSAGQLSAVTDFSGRVVTYQYYQGVKGDLGGAGDLKSVTSPPVTGTPDGNDFPDGKTTTYTYSTGYANDAENHLLLSVIDAKGQTACTHVYQHNQTDFEFLRCIADQAGTNTPAVFTYLPQTPAPSNDFAVVRCVMNDPVGDVTESYCDARNRCITERDYTGRATPGLPVTDTDNRPTGKLRSDDPDYYETQWTWNNDSLCTSEISPGGQQVQCVYQSDFDPATSARKRADCRVVRELASSAVDLDGDGVADVTHRAWYYTYDPRFGSDPTPAAGADCSSGPPTGVILAAMEAQGSDLMSGGGWGGIFGGMPAGDNIRRVKAEMYVERITAGVSVGYTYAKRAAIMNNQRKDVAAIKTYVEQAITSSQSSRLLPTVNKRTGMAMELFFDGYEKGGSAMYVNPRSIARQQYFFSQTERRDAIDSFSWHQITLDYDGFGRPASITDPRGNVTTGAYDANGNRVKVQFHWDRQSTADQDFSYNSNGQLATITNAPDANGNRRVDAFSYYTGGSQSGYLQSIAIDEPGVHLTSAFEYDARGNVTRCVDPRGNDCLFTYSALDQCVRAESPTNLTARCVTDYDYDADDNLVQSSVDVRDDTDTKLSTRTTSFDYDLENRLIRVTEPISKASSAVTEFAYDANDQLTEIHSPLAVLGLDSHNIQAFQYDERGLLFRETAAPGSGNSPTNEFDYNPNGQTERQDAIESLVIKQITLDYDGFGRPASITDPMGNVAACTYDLNDNLVYSRVDAESVDVPGGAGNRRYSECRWQYDALDRCVQSSEAFFNPATQLTIGSGVAISTCAYAPNGECESAADSLGHTTTFAYDTACRLTGVTDPHGNTRAFVRDADDNITAVTATDLPDLGGKSQSFTATFAYDALNRCVSSGDNVGNTSSCAYDSLDRVVLATDANGNDTTCTYDLLGNCLASTNYAGSSSILPPAIVRSGSFGYDNNSRRITSTDANGNTTAYAYDSLDRLAARTNADGTAQKLIWSPRSNLIGEEDANGTTVTNIYDLCDRIIHRDIAARNVLATTTFETFAYDGCSQLVTASNDVSSVSFSYDSLGNCTGGSQDGLAQSAAHDSEGNLLSLTYPSGRVVTYSYDALNQVANIATTGGGVSHPQLAQFAYAGPGRLARINRDNGINTLVDWDGLVSPANPAGDYGSQQASHVRHGTTASPSLLADIAGTYDRMQSKSSQSDAVSGRSTTLTFDALDQLVESSVHLSGAPLLDTVYALDSNGNRQLVTTNGVAMPDYTMNNAVPPGDFEMNRYTSTPFGSQQYDANGNLVARGNAGGVTYYHYDYADRLVEMDALNGLGTVAPVLTFTYDALGHRISKTTYPASPLAPVTTQYVHDDCDDGNDILEERVTGSPSRIYVIGGYSASDRKWEDDSIDVTLAAFPANGQAQYYHYDDLGNTVALTDASGNVLERYAYDDYGQPQFLAADGSPLVDSGGLPVTSSPAGNPYLFHGMEWDGESGLLSDDGNDYFDPQTGRAVRRKVKGIKNAGDGGSPPDVFVGNNPWSGSGGGGGGDTLMQKKGTVKFFNDAKGFGFMAKTHTKTGHVTLMK